MSLLKRYSITGWIVKKSFLPKIIKNRDLHFSDTSLEYFVLVLFLVVLITLYVSTCFSSALNKGNLVEFSTPSTILWDWWKMELEDLVTWNGWGKGHMGLGRDFLVGKDTPKGTMLINQASFYIYKKSNFTRPNKENVFGRA